MNNKFESPFNSTDSTLFIGFHLIMLGIVSLMTLINFLVQNYIFAILLSAILIISIIKTFRAFEDRRNIKVMEVLDRQNQF